MGCTGSKSNEADDGVVPYRRQPENSYSNVQTNNNRSSGAVASTATTSSKEISSHLPEPSSTTRDGQTPLPIISPGGGAPRSSSNSSAIERPQVHDVQPVGKNPVPPTASSNVERRGTKQSAPASVPIPPQSTSSALNPPKMRRARSDVPQPDSSSGFAFGDLYELRDVLGTGAFSTVRSGTHKDHPRKSYAIKCVTRAKLSDEDASALLDEVAILRELKHKHIIRLYDFFEDLTHFYLVMEKMTGGELFDRIVAKAYYNEKEARDVCKILLEAVGYCHQMGVAHRDLKPENLLLVSEESDSEVKIADFGFAKRVYSPRSLTTQCGTPGYVAPEILSGVPYDTRADMWSVGVILYILLGGYPPFIDNNQRELFRKIRRGDYEFHEEYWGTVSSEAKSLIRSLLKVDPMKRLSASEALKNEWILRDDEELATHDLGANLEALKLFNAKRKFKAAVSTVLAVNKLQDLGKEFMTDLD